MTCKIQARRNSNLIFAIKVGNLQAFEISPLCEDEKFLVFSPGSIFSACLMTFCYAAYTRYIGK